jgi:ELWxxDGT repeat protein
MRDIFSSLLIIFFFNITYAQQNITTLQGITTTKAINSTVFFSGNHNQYGVELFVWKEQTGTIEFLKDINPGYESSSPDQFIVFKNQLFFIAYVPDYGLSVWKSDGTSEGTQLVYGAKDSNPSSLLIFKDKLYFTTSLGSIIRTDGTMEGTEVFYQAKYTWGRITNLIYDDQYIYFTEDARTIYQDDGTSRISFLAPLSWEDVNFKNIFILENTLLVIKSSTYDNVIRVYSISKDALGNGHEEEDWELIKKLDAPIYGTQEIGNFTNISGKLFFSFRTNYDNVKPTDELWICDGTEDGTLMLKSFDRLRYFYQSEMSMFFAFQGKLFFRAGEPSNRSLWTSNGTPEGTIKFHDVIITPPYNDQRIPVIITENNIYFSGAMANDSYNVELWSSDGTYINTKQVFDLEDDGGSFPHDFSFSNDVLYFLTSIQFSATLWSTVPVADISLTNSSSNIIKSGSSPSLFYDVAVGECKTSDLLIHNKGLGKLYLKDIVVTGKDFYLMQKPIPESIEPGEYTIVQVVFNPVKESKSHSTLTIFSSDLDESKYVIYLSAIPSTRASTEICMFPKNGFTKRLEPVETTSPIILSNSTIAEGQSPGTVIGDFSFPINSIFMLISGEGDTDNQHFSVEGNLLKSKTVFNFNIKSLYSIRVRATSQEGELEGSLRIRVVNASFDFTDEECRPTFQGLNFTYTSIEVNSNGHLFVTTNDGKILRSVDDGRNWEIIYISNYSGLSKIIFKGSTGYAHGNNVLLKSDDAGATWFRLYVPHSDEYSFNDLAVFFLNATEGYIGTNKGEIFYTKDGGRTWETRQEASWNEFRKIFFQSKDRGYATVGWGDLLQTTNGGRSWTSVDLSTLGWNTRVRDLWFTNDKDGFLILENKFYSTKNDGSTWMEVTAVNVGDLSSIKFFNENLGFLFGGNGLIYKTNNGGTTWSQIFPGISPGQIVGIAQSSGKLFITSKSYYSSEYARALAVSTDEGTTWSMLNHSPGGYIYHIDFTTDNKGAVIGQEGIFKTEDNGLTWNAMVTDLTNIADMHFIDNNVVLLVSDGNIYKSTDGGTTTRIVLTTEQIGQYLPAGKLYATPDNTLFSVSWYAIYRSDDQGETWEMISLNPGYYTQGMHFISSAIGYRVELFGSIEKTTDSGKTWVEIFTRDPEAADPFNAIFFINESLGYKGGNFLQRTINGGISWEKVNWPFYEILSIHFQNENHGYVVTRGGYVYETNNAGETWETIFYSSNPVTDAQFINEEIFLAGSNGFVARMSTTSIPPSIPGYIYGPDLICVGDATEFYLAVNNNDGTQWSTTAGSIEDHNEYLVVNFPNPGVFTITAKHFNSCGISDARSTTVTVSAAPTTPVIEGPNPSVSGEKNVVYTVINNNEDSRFLWDVDGSLSVLPVDNKITIDWANQIESAEIKVLEVDSYGCRAYGNLNIELGIPLGVETTLQNQVSLYPNPTETDTKIVSAIGGLLFVRILDTLGKEYSRTILYGNEEQTLLTKLLPSGFYLVEISDGQHTVTKKLIKN